MNFVTALWLLTVYVGVMRIALLAQEWGIWS